jgi:hypothetical protein
MGTDCKFFFIPPRTCSPAADITRERDFLNPAMDTGFFESLKSSGLCMS